jgi:hypothetical protein
VENKEFLLIVGALRVQVTSRFTLSFTDLNRRREDFLEEALLW